MSLPRPRRYWLEISALGFAALAMLIAFVAIGLTMFVASLVGNDGLLAGHDRVAWAIAWAIEAAAGAFAGAEIARRAANPVYHAISRHPAWQIALAGLPPIVVLVLLGIPEIGADNPPSKVVATAVGYAAGFPLGAIAGVLRRRLQG